MRVKIFSVAFLLLMLNAVLLYAQAGGPCGFNDDDNDDCPLDTWIIILAVVAVAFAATHLYRNHKLSLAGKKEVN